MIDQLNMYGKTKVEQAIERIQLYEPPEGYYLAFSGGKDSVVLKALADMSGVKYDAHYNITSVDPPELVQFVKTFDDVKLERQHYKDGTPITMWNLIPRRRLPPRMISRYCCEKLKEQAGEGRFVMTGVRHAESVRRKNTRAGLETSETKTGKRELYDPDNPNQELIHICRVHSQRILNPIIDWTTAEVWEFIKKYNVSYCKLYDEGYTRLGCIGCPMAANQREELEKYPKFRQAYIRAFDRMLEARKENGLETQWKNGEEVMAWWLKDKK